MGLCNIYMLKYSYVVCVSIVFNNVFFYKKNNKRMSNYLRCMLVLVLLKVGLYLYVYLCSSVHRFGGFLCTWIFVKIYGKAAI